MHIHRLEKIWLTFGLAMLFVFLGILGISAFAMGAQPPSPHRHMIDPTRVQETAPFDAPGIKQVADGEYEAVMIAYAFGYSPNKMEVPAGSTVHFTITSPDVIHGFEIPGTNVNMMVIPGEVSQISHKFTKPGEYLILCNEYCGTGHEYMNTVIVVK
ncbi:cytochrome c oxidase subunit II [Paenibacillus validus]|uniref:cytochrome c oxidase subunit II n=1 Tax=Paenibacillus TaxID=44249 RepID=UPI0006D0FC7A|nr:MULTISPECIES: cytochrome c oxidase subunit II [Paenibacillus]MED4601524.1 cytochrome c oxidase subunit II [Paenibacillus validus]MED4607901.1 cytochrome c oxidase subunit II [Paenibacillus validus]